MQFESDVEVKFEFVDDKKNSLYQGYRPAHMVKENYLTTGVHKYYNMENAEKLKEDTKDNIIEFTNTTKEGIITVSNKTKDSVINATNKTKSKFTQWKEKHLKNKNWRKNGKTGRK